MSLILIDKPEGPTSHAVVAAMKRALSVTKVGHLGTLDPFASGLLPIMVGNTARLADEAMDGKKGYQFVIGLGSQTDTLDPSGRVVCSAPLPTELNAQKVDSALNLFRGQIEQVPPAYSALKVNGMPLYEYMRATGELPIDIESKRRTITVHSLECLEHTDSRITLRVVCSKGTYVRSLARDIALALGSCGTCVELRRELVEPWDVKNALKVFVGADGKVLPPDREQVLAYCQPPWSMTPHLTRFIIDKRHKEKFISGNHFTLSSAEFENFVAGRTAMSEVVGEIQKAYVQCEEVSFLCELHSLPDQLFRLQPRKRIS
jgi:tRNA pseudouridine55 synthase